MEISLDMVRRAETVKGDRFCVKFVGRFWISEYRDQSLLDLFRCVSEFTGHTPHNSHEPDELGRKITESIRNVKIHENYKEFRYIQNLPL